MALTATVAVALAAGMDRAVAEPPESVHPVALLGRLIEPIDREWSTPRVVGAITAVALPGLAAGTAGGAVYVIGAVDEWLAAVAAGLVLFSSVSLRLLHSTALDVLATTDTDLDAARRDLRALAGRDASALSAGEIRSAAVESAAENLADGLVAPLGAFAAGVVVVGVAGSYGGVGEAIASGPAALALGAAGAAWIKAVNTLDSMLGYRSKPVGWAPARLDDVAMWAPARATALLLAIAAGDPGAVVRARDDARAPSSPNSGWPMATLATALSIRLAKPGHYVLGDDAAPLPDLAAAERGVRIVARAGWLAVALAGVIVWP